MQRLKNMLTGVILSGMVLTPVQGVSFTDTTDHWAKSYIETVVEAGMMSGTGEGVFSPESTMTMGQFAVVLTQGAFGGEKISLETDDHWADPYLNVLIEKNLFINSAGADITPFSTGWEDKPAYRYQVVSMVSRLMEGKYPQGDLSNIVNYRDISSIYDEYKQDIANVVANRVMTGLSESEFGVSGVFTRGEATVVISRLLQLELLLPTSTTADPEPEPTTPRVIVPADTNQDGVLTQDEINAVFDAYKVEYPQGTRWNNDNSYYSSAMRITGYGCAGWAFMLSDSIFGTQPRYEITRDELRAGDFWHTGTHFGVVMEVKGNNYLCTEGNFNSSIYWDYSRGTSYLTEKVTYYSRYPR